MAAHIVGPETLAYRLRVAVAWLTAVIGLGLLLLRQADWNAKVLLDLRGRLRSRGHRVKGLRANLVTTPFGQYVRLLAQLHLLARDDAAAWRERLAGLRKELHGLSHGTTIQRDCLVNEDLRKLQRDLVQQILRRRLNLTLAPEHAGVFGLYRRCSDALTDFLDYCHYTVGLASREAVLAAVPQFVFSVRKWNAESGTCPPPGFFANGPGPRSGAWRNLLLHPARTFVQIYWGKPHLERVRKGFVLPANIEAIIARHVAPPDRFSRFDLRAALTYEMSLQGCRRLLASWPALEAGAPEAELAGDLEAAITSLIEGAVAFAMGRKAPPRGSWRGTGPPLKPSG